MQIALSANQKKPSLIGLLPNQSGASHVANLPSGQTFLLGAVLGATGLSNN